MNDRSRNDATMVAETKCGQGWLGVVAGLMFCGAIVAYGAQPTPTVTVINTGPGSPRTTKAANRDQTVTAPVPVGLVSARKAFLSNGGADAGLFPHPFTGSQDRAFGALLKMAESGDRFELVGTPGEADVVIELQLIAPNEALGGSKQKGSSDPLPTFKLIAYDRPTHYILWTVMQTVDSATLQKTHDKNFDDALNSVWAQMLAAASGRPLAAAPESPEEKK